MQITVKGQVTIPKLIRLKFGFLPHTEVEFIVKNGQVILQKAKKTKVASKSPLSKMVGRANTTLTTDEIMKLTRDKA